MMVERAELNLDKRKHIVFFQRTLGVLPCRFTSLDSNRLTIAFFALSGLDVMGSLDVLSQENRREIIDWIYGLQVLPNKNQGPDKYEHCGFKGSTTIASKGKGDGIYNMAHIAMTYTGLASLIILGDDLSRVNKLACLKGVKSLQLDDGSFKSTCDGGENDMRFIYCAACICTMLNDFSAIDINKAVNFIKKSMCYDGGFGQGPNHESHGGSTFCAVASLVMFNQLHSCLSPKDIRRLQHWCIHRQKQGFHGRPHKDDDTCYSFWVGATLELLGMLKLCDWEENKHFVLTTQDLIVGGFGKWPQSHPDPLHSYMGLCGLSLMNEFELNPICPTLNITERAQKHLLSLHEQWIRNKTEPEDTTISHRKTATLAFVIGVVVAVIPWVLLKLKEGK